MTEPWPWRWFRPTERGICSPDTGECRMNPVFMDRLDGLRYVWGRPISITSGYRTKAHNTAVGGSPRSAHMLGRAVDLRMPAAMMPDFITLARQHGFTGFGIGDDWMHIDDMNDQDRARPMLWTYKSL